MNPKAVVPAVAVMLLFGAGCASGSDDIAQTDSSVAGEGDEPDAGGDEDEPVAGAGDATQPADDSGSSGEIVDVEGSSGATDSPEDQAPAEPLATAEGGPPFTGLEIVDLRRTGDSVTLEFVIITDDGSGATNRNPREVFAAPQDQVGSDEGPSDELRASVSGVTLVDKTNEKRHLVLRDSNGNCLCTGFDTVSVDENARYPQSAQFPAPPEDVDVVTVEVPHFPAIDNVPLRTAG
jgi:hypothetical protein